jgi:hypothetical protein
MVKARPRREAVGRGWFQNEPVLISRSSSIGRPYTEAQYKVHVSESHVQRFSKLNRIGSTSKYVGSTAMNLNEI